MRSYKEWTYKYSRNAESSIQQQNIRMKHCHSIPIGALYLNLHDLISTNMEFRGSAICHYTFFSAFCQT